MTKNLIEYSAAIATHTIRKKQMKQPHILLFDIETTPLTIHSWRHYQTDSLAILEDFYILCFSYKWYGKNKIHVKSLTDYPSYSKDIKSDKNLMKDMWDLFDKADIVVGHNSDKFDVKKTNSRLVINGFKPYSPFRQIDTLKMARKSFGFTSNRLDDLGRCLGVGRKEKVGGKLQMWFDCMAGNTSTESKKSWQDMKRYAKQDVVLLENVYDILKPWASPVNMGLFVDNEEPVCPKCGNDELMKRGTSSTNSGIYQRYQCKNKECRGYSRSRYKVTKSGNPLTS